MSIKQFSKKQVLSIVLGVFTIVGGIVAIPTIYYWINTPQVSVKVGKHELDNNKKIVLHYILPTVDKQDKSILPFPLVLSNETESDIRNFYLQIKALTKEVIIDNKHVGLGMKRILEYSDYSSDAGNHLIKLRFKNPDKNSAYQYADNQKAKITLHPGEEIMDYIMLNAIKEDSLKNENPWDAFSLELDAISRGKEKHYNISIACYYSTNTELTTQQISQQMDKSVTNIVIKVELENIVVNKKENTIFGHYVLNETENSIIIL